MISSFWRNTRTGILVSSVIVMGVCIYRLYLGDWDLKTMRHGIEKAWRGVGVRVESESAESPGVAGVRYCKIEEYPRAGGSRDWIPQRI